MSKLLCLLMLIALFVSCSSDDNTDPDDGNGSNTMAGIYKGGRASEDLLILLPNFKGVYVKKDEPIERFTWKPKGKNSIETEISSGETYLCEKNTNPNYLYDCIYRGSSFSKIIEPAQMIIDKSIVGKWKVKYSNTIIPVFYFKSEEELAQIKERAETLEPDIDWHWYRQEDMGWDQRSSVREYNGGMYELVSSFLFSQYEMAIELTEDFLLRTYKIDYANMRFIPIKTTFYRVENNKIVKGEYLDQGEAGWLPMLMHCAYNFEGGNLVIKQPRESQSGNVMVPVYQYIISKYSKITE